MGITVHWDNAEKTMIRFALSGDWTWTEFDIGVTETFAMIDSIQYRVAVVIYSLDSPRVYSPPNAMKYLWRFMRTRWQGYNLIVLVGPMPYAKSLYHIFARLIPAVPQYITFADTLEDGRRKAAEWLVAREKT
jgi:hypothetical protein